MGRGDTRSGATAQPLRSSQWLGSGLAPPGQRFAGAKGTTSAFAAPGFTPPGFAPPPQRSRGMHGLHLGTRRTQLCRSGLTPASQRCGL